MCIVRSFTVNYDKYMNRIHAAFWRSSGYIIEGSFPKAWIWEFDSLAIEESLDLLGGCLFKGLFLLNQAMDAGKGSHIGIHMLS